MSQSQFRKKRGDTKIKGIEKQYGVDFGVRSDMRLDTFLDQKGYPSLSKAIRKVSEKRSNKK